MLPAAATSPSIPFSPPQDQLPLLLAALADPEFSLAAVADRFKTTSAALAAWLSLDSSQPHLDTLASALAGRARLVAMSALPAVVRIALKIVEDHKFLPEGPQHSGLTAYDFQAAAEHRRNSQCRRLAAWLLYKISRFSTHPFLAPPRAVPSSSSPQAASTQPIPAARPIPAPTPRMPELRLAESPPAQRQSPLPPTPAPDPTAPPPHPLLPAQPTLPLATPASPHPYDPLHPLGLEQREPPAPLLLSRKRAGAATLALAAGTRPHTPLPYNNAKSPPRHQLRPSTPRAP